MGEVDKGTNDDHKELRAIIGDADGGLGPQGRGPWEPG